MFSRLPGGRDKAKNDVASRSSDEYLDESDEEFTGMSSEMEDDMTWVEWFCSVKGNEFYVEVDEDYIRDDFNLSGLSSAVPCYEKALDVILDAADEDDEDEDDDETSSWNDDQSQSVIINSAQSLYGLIHARYILTHRGLNAMLEKYNSCIYGLCPNIYCSSQPVVPIGLSDTVDVEKAKVFCPRCNEVYNPSSSRMSSIDGAFFGTTFPHIFFMQYEHLVSKNVLQHYVPRIYGFNVWRGVRDKLRAECLAVRNSTAATAQKGGSGNN